MATRKPKTIPVISKFHPMSLTCPLCNAEPYLVCVRVEGDGWNDFTLRLWHKERFEAGQIAEIFED